MRFFADTPSPRVREWRSAHCETMGRRLNLAKFGLLNSVIFTMALFDSGRTPLGFTALIGTALLFRWTLHAKEAWEKALDRKCYGPKRWQR